MKRKLIVLIVFAIMALTPIVAVYGASIDIDLVTETQEYNADETDEPLKVEIELGDFVSIPENEPLAYTGTIEYDTKLFSDVKIEGKNEWSATYNKTNNMLLGDTVNAVANTKIAELKFYVNKENVKTNENTTIKLKDILLSDGNFEIKANKEIEIKILSSRGSSTINDNQNAQQVKSLSIISGEEIVSHSAGGQEENLPNAGPSKPVLLVILGILLVLAIIFRIKCRKIKY